MFIGREDELKQLEEFSKRQVAGIIVCSGRRRIGKSTLIEHFGQKKQFFEFYGLAPRDNISNQDQLRHFGQQMANNFHIPAVTYDNWYDALTMLASLTRQSGPTLIFFDEISWMASKDKDFPAILKGIWDTQFKKNMQLILILCGSVSSWIQENILEDTGFMGRISLTLHLKELPLPSANQFWQGIENISSYEKCKVLGVTGGVPRYLEEINPHQTAEQNIKRLCFTAGGVLLEEFNKIFSDLFGKQADDYKEIVRCLLNKHLEIEGIAQQLKVTQSGYFNKKIKVLEACGFIKRDYIWQNGKRKNKLSKYRLSDNYLRFYLKYIEPKKPLIEAGLFHDLHLEELDDWYSLMGLQFENLILSNLRQIQQHLDISPSSIVSAAPYFQNKTQRQEACQIDLLIDTKFTLYVCETKFQKKISSDIINEVLTKIKRLKVSKTLSVRPVLIYEGELSERIARENFFSHIIRFNDLL